MPAGGPGGVRVIVHQPADGGVRISRLVGSGERAGVLAEQIVQEVAAGRGLGDQMMVVELIELTAGGWHVDVVEGGRGVGIDVRARGQAQPPEQPLLRCGEVGVGQVERGGDRQVLGAHDGQPGTGRRQVRGQFGTGPGRVMPEPRGEHPDRQRKVPAQPGYLTGRACS